MPTLNKDAGAKYIITSLIINVGICAAFYCWYRSVEKWNFLFRLQNQLNVFIHLPFQVWAKHNWFPNSVMTRLWIPLKLTIAWERNRLLVLLSNVCDCIMQQQRPRCVYYLLSKVRWRSSMYLIITKKKLFWVGSGVKNN